MDKDARNKLLEAARQLFAAKGYDAVSLRDLAEASGVNAALISYHFGGKQGLYDAVIQSDITHFFAGFNIPESAKLEPEERILRFVKNIAAVHKKYPYLCNLMNSELNRPSACFETMIKPKICELHKFFSATVSEGIAKGQFRRDLDPLLAPLAILGLLQFYFIENTLMKQVFAVDENADEEFGVQVIKIYFDGIRNREGKA